MARLSFDFLTTETVTRSFDPDEFRGVDYMDIKTIIRSEVPNADHLDVIRAATAIYAAAQELPPEMQRG